VLGDDFALYVRIVAVLLCGDGCVCTGMACDDAMTWLIYASQSSCSKCGDRVAMRPTSAHSGWTWTRDIASTRLLFPPQARNDATCNFNVLYLGTNAIKVARIKEVQVGIVLISSNSTDTNDV
jgi:hypothetical protein